MGRGLRTALAASLLVAGCGASAGLEAYPPPPEVSGAEAWLLGLRAAGRTRLAAVARAEGPVEWSVSQDDLRVGAVLVAYAYEAPLEVLGLSAGRVEPGPGRSCRLEAPAAAFELDPDLAGGWRPAPVALDDGARARLFGSAPCAPSRVCDDFRVHTIETGTTAITALAALDSTRALAADAAGRFWVLDEAGATERADLHGLPSGALAAGADGEWWFGGAGGEVRRGPLGGPYARWTIGTATQTVHGLLVAPPGAWAVVRADEPDEEGFEGATYAFDGETWTRRHRQIHVDARPEKTALVALDSGQVVVTYGATDVFVFEGETVTPVFIGTGDFLTQVAASLYPLSGGRYLTGGRRGELIVSNAANGVVGRRPLLLPDTIYAVRPDRDGLLLAGAGGWVRQVGLEDAPCPERQVHPTHVWDAVGLGSRVLLSGPRAPPHDRTRVTVLTRP